MDEAFDLADYLPVSFKTPSEQDYLALLWATFEENYNKTRYQFAFLSYYLLMMSFAYSKIWQIRETWPSELAKALIGFGTKDESTLLKSTSPFDFATVSESAALRLFRLIGCDNAKIGQYLKLVKERNSIAHANGHISFASQRQVDEKIREVLRAVKEVQAHSHPVIQQCYQRFLIDSHDPHEREYVIAEDQTREVLVHGNYLSQKDIELCSNLDLAVLPLDNKQSTKDLHNTLCEVYET